LESGGYLEIEKIKNRKMSESKSSRTKQFQDWKCAKDSPESLGRNPQRESVEAVSTFGC
jgi:hypothetical protein